MRRTDFRKFMVAASAIVTGPLVVVACSVVTSLDGIRPLPPGNTPDGAMPLEDAKVGSDAPNTSDVKVVASCDRKKDFAAPTLLSNDVSNTGPEQGNFRLSADERIGVFWSRVSGGQPSIFSTTRSDANALFTNISQLTSLNSPSAATYDPTLTGDGLSIVSVLRVLAHRKISIRRLVPIRLQILGPSRSSPT